MLSLLYFSLRFFIDLFASRGFDVIDRGLFEAVFASTNQALSVEQRAVDGIRRTVVAKNLSTHSTMVSAAIHRERFLTSITNLAKTIRHPELLVGSVTAFTFHISFGILIQQTFLWVNKNGKQMLLCISRQRKF